MSTTEKLFVEILKRKERIIDQFKHQIEQFDPHLAATLLLDGITPPPWLLHSQSSDPKEWKKEELISEVLLPHPQVQIPYAGDKHLVLDGPAVTGNTKFVTGLSRDDYPLREHSDANDGQPVLSEVLRCDVTDVAELNCPMKSPLHQTEGMISDPAHNLDQSLARIQRSRSRQKALEIRSSANASKTSLHDKCHSAVEKCATTATGIPVSLSERINNMEQGEMNAGRLGTSSSGTDGPLVVDDWSKKKGTGICDNTVVGPIISELQPPPVDESMQLVSSLMAMKDDAAKFSKVCNILGGPHSVVGDIATKTSPCVVGNTNNGLDSMNVEYSQCQVADISERRVSTPRGADSSRLCDHQVSEASFPSASQILNMTPYDSAHKNSFDRRLSRGVDQEAQEDLDTAQEGSISGSHDIACSKSCNHLSSEKSVLLEQYSSPCLEDLCPQHMDTSVERKLSETPSASEILKAIPSDSAQHNCQNTKSGTEIEQEADRPDPEEKIRAPLCNGSALQHLRSSESCRHQIPEESAASEQYSIPGLEDLCPQSGQVSVTNMFIKSPSSLLGLKNVQDGSLSRVEVDQEGDSEKVIIAQNGDGSSPQSLRIIPDSSHENFQHGSSRIEVDHKAHPKEVITAQNDDITSPQDMHNSELCENQISEKSDSSRQYSIHGLGNLHLQSGHSIESRLIKPPSPIQSLKFKFTPDTFRENFQHVVSIREEGHQETQREVITPQNGSASGKQDECCTRSSNLQILENSSPGSENLGNQSKQKSVEGGVIRPPSGLEGCKAIPFGSAHRNSEYRSLSRVEASRVIEPEEFIAAKDGGASALQDVHIDVEAVDSEESFTAQNGNAEHLSVNCDMKSDVLQNCEQHEIEFRCSQMQHVEEVEADLQPKDRCTEERTASLDRGGAARQNLADSARQNLADSRVCLLATEMPGTCVGQVDPTEEDKSRQEAENDSKLGDGGHSAYLEEPICKSVPQLEESLLISDNLIGSPPPKSLELRRADPIMPVMERFIMQKGAGQSWISEDGCSFEKFNFEDPIIESATAHEELCRSAYLCTPSTHLSPVDKLPKASSLYQSVPTGLLEYMELRNTSTMRTNFFGEEVSCAFDGKSYSDCFTFPVAQNSESKACRSPLITLWDRINSNSGSSKAKASLNPELPCISEENEIADEASTQGISLEMAENSVKRIPLANIAEDSNCPAPVSDVENDLLLGRCSLESTTSVICNTRMRKRPREKPESNRMSKTRYTDKMSKNMSQGTSVAKNSKEPLHNRFSKPKTSLQKGRSDISVKESKRENIVCNVTSFLPLVQQKQAAAPLTGKRDVKVKALEAAEAAKRQAEKREMERKMKKEAMKMERTKVENENLRRLEQERKQKEEERKKKEAEIAARKRVREEEKIRENERKRKRVEEAKKHQEEQKEKLRSKKEEKEAKLRAKHEKKDVTMESGSVILETCATPWNCRTSAQLTSTFHQATPENFTRDGNQEPSYEISPYRDSDNEDEDEDEDDDDERNDKFVPSWACKSRIALEIASQQRWDPNAIFPRDSFCSISEVCLPRKYQLKMK